MLNILTNCCVLLTAGGSVANSVHSSLKIALFSRRQPESNRSTPVPQENVTEVNIIGNMYNILSAHCFKRT